MWLAGRLQLRRPDRGKGRIVITAHPAQVKPRMDLRMIRDIFIAIAWLISKKPPLPFQLKEVGG
jgi:hypothetical protein